MSVTVQCPRCKMELDAPDSLVGKPATCPGCQSQFLVARPKAGQRRSGSSKSKTSQGTAGTVSASAEARNPRAEKVVSQVGSETNAKASANKIASESRSKRMLESSSSAFDPPVFDDQKAVEKSKASDEQAQASAVHPPAEKTEEQPLRLFGRADSGAGVARFRSPDETDSTHETEITESEQAKDASPAKDSKDLGKPILERHSESLLNQHPEPESKAKSVARSGDNHTTSRQANRVRPDSAKEAGAKDSGKAPKTEPTANKTNATTRRAKISVERPSSNRQVRSAKLLEEADLGSRLQLGADGTLPQLNVVDVESKAKKEETSSGSNPLVLIAVLAASLTISVVALLAPTQSEQEKSSSLAESIAHIEEHYFGTEPFDEYQVLLRRAIEHENRGERPQAKQIYRRVLDMIHSESFDGKKGLTGPTYQELPPSDSDLERHLQSLIRIRN